MINSMEYKSEMDIRLAALIIAEVADKNLPIHVQVGFPYESENGNKVSSVILEYADSYNENVSALITEKINCIAKI